MSIAHNGCVLMSQEAIDNLIEHCMSEYKCFEQDNPEYAKQFASFASRLGELLARAMTLNEDTIEVVVGIDAGAYLLRLRERELTKGEDA